MAQGPQVLHVVTKAVYDVKSTPRTIELAPHHVSTTPAAGSIERQSYSQARNHCASNAAIFENSIQHVQEI